ncbi:MAG: D-glycerate dehydrogenase [Chloroflexota bacterium]
MTKQKVYATRARVPEAIELLQALFEVEVWPETTPPPKEVVLDQASKCHAIMTEVDDQIDEEILEAGKDNLQVIANRGVGYNNIDVEAATARNIKITNTPGILAEACADMTFALILSIARKVVFGDRAIRNGEWTVFDQVPYLGTDVYGKKLGIIGLGDIGEKVVKRSIGFDMEVFYHSRTAKIDLEEKYRITRLGFEDILSTCDYVSLHVPLSPETEQMISDRELAMMQKESFLINMSRGPTVDLDALNSALVTGQIAGAAIDVTDPEPVPVDHPIVNNENVVITPHIGSASRATFTAMGVAAANNIVAALQDKPIPSAVN